MSLLDSLELSSLPTDEQIEDAIKLIKEYYAPEQSTDFDNAAIIVAEALEREWDYHPDYTCIECGSNNIEFERYQTIDGPCDEMYCASCGSEELAESPQEAIRTILNNADSELAALKRFLDRVLLCQDKEQITSLWRETKGFLPDGDTWAIQGVKNEL